MGDARNEALLARLESDPRVCGGQMCIKGTRIPVTLILDALAAGETAEEIQRGYPSLAREDISAALAYGAKLARERNLPLVGTS